MRNIKSKPLYQTLWYIYLYSILFPLLSIAVTLAVFTSKNVIQDTIQTNYNLLTTIAFNIETLVEEMEQTSLQWVNITEFSSYYKKVNENNGYSPAYPVNLEKEYTVASRNVLANSSPSIYSICFYSLRNTSKNCIISKRYNDIIFYNGYDAEQQPWFRQALQHKGNAVLTVPRAEPYYTNKENDAYFSVVRAVFNVDSGLVYGIIKVDASTEYFKNLFSGLNFGQDSGILLVDSEGNIIYSVNEKLNDRIHIENNNIRASSRRYMIQQKAISGSNWTLVSISSWADLLFSACVILLTTAVIGLLTILISVFLFARSSRQLTEPMNRILASMRDTKAGDLKARIPLSNTMPLEFYNIAKEHNHMLDKIKELIDSQYKAKINQQRAEFAALQTQINPHFLYNVLGNFISLNRIGYRKELEESIIALTELFRYTSRTSHESTVVEELFFIERYLKLQHVRYRDRLVYTISCVPEAEDFLIPRLLLQPLVENCVIHGTEPVDRLVHIEVSAALLSAGTILVFHVRDDGAGVDMEKYRTLHGNTGLTNIQSRLHLFAPDSSFVFHSAPDHGTDITITIPTKQLERRTRNENHSGR